MLILLIVGTLVRKVLTPLASQKSMKVVGFALGVVLERLVRLWPVAIPEENDHANT
jgi:hypothetical protein